MIVTDFPVIVSFKNHYIVGKLAVIKKRKIVILKINGKRIVTYKYAVL